MVTSTNVWGKRLFDQMEQARLSGKKVVVATATERLVGTIALVEDGCIAIDRESTTEQAGTRRTRTYVFREYVISVTLML